MKQFIFLLCALPLMAGCMADFRPTSTPTKIIMSTQQARPTAGKATQQPTATATAAPAPTPPRCIVSTGYTGGTVNVRSGPGMAYPVVDIVGEGETLPLFGQTVHGWQRVTTAKLVSGWFYVISWCEGRE